MDWQWNVPPLMRNILISILIFATATILGYVFHVLKFSDTNIVIVYLVAVLVIVWICKNFTIGLVVSVAGTIAFNYFFAAPQFTFKVNDPNYYITFVCMTLTALAVSTLTSRARKETQIANEMQEETRSVYMLTNQLVDVQSVDDIVHISLKSICEGLQCNAGFLVIDEKGDPEDTYVFQTVGEDGRIIHRETGDIEKIRWNLMRKLETFESGGEFTDLPLYGVDSNLGIIRIETEDYSKFNEMKKSLLHSMVDSIAMAMDRFQTAKQRILSKEEAAKERYRANLLRAISHDIRTPLTGIIGTSEMLEDALKDNEYCHGLAAGITADAEWLHGLVENILNMTRLQDGSMKLNKESVPIEEVIGSAIEHVEMSNPKANIDAEIPEELIMVPMDPKLIQQVIINLLNNAIKHSEEGAPILIKAGKTSEDAVFHVIDSGEGIPEENLPYIFQSFFSVEKSNITENRGFGLGLSICETIVNAHDGTIKAANRADRSGTVITFTLPLEGKNE